MPPIPSYVHCLALTELGIEEVPSKGSVVWEGESSPSQAQLDMFLPALPGVASRIMHDTGLQDPGGTV